MVIPKLLFKVYDNHFGTGTNPSELTLAMADPLVPTSWEVWRFLVGRMVMKPLGRFGTSNHYRTI